MENWCVKLGQEDGCLSEGRGNCLKYLKWRWNIKQRRGNKNLKKGGGQSRLGVLKRGLETP